jgi:hypothetical protein
VEPAAIFVTDPDAIPSSTTYADATRSDSATSPTPSTAVREALSGRGAAVPIGAATVVVSGKNAPAGHVETPRIPAQPAMPTPGNSGSPTGAAGAAAGAAADQATAASTLALSLATGSSSLPSDDAVPTSLSSDPGSSPD